MKIFYSPRYTIATHSFETTRKSRWIAESLLREPISGIELVAPEPTSAAALSCVHDPEYVDAVRNGNPRELAESQGFHWDPALWKMVCASNGGVTAAATDALHTRRVSGSLSSGLHHARRARGKGYCTFNGLVLAACAALDAGAGTVLILDLDAHCGGGTHELIDGEERIWQMDVSVDAFDHYEPLGNNQLEMVHDASRYLPTIERKLTWLEREAPRFDICLYNAGMDPFEGCSIGGMRGVTQKVLSDREVAVFSWCRMRSIPIAFVLEGGYLGPEGSAGLVALHRLTLEAACVSDSGPKERATVPHVHHRDVAMANQVGVVDTGYVQVRVSCHRRPEEIGKIGLSVAQPNATFHFKLYAPETHVLAGRLSSVASQLSDSPYFRSDPMFKGNQIQIRARIVDDRIGLSVQVGEQHGVGAEVRFTLAPHEVDRLADLLAEALVSGGHMSRKPEL
jgi:acetoin utilization deacetylase AcuC-like enzyme